MQTHSCAFNIPSSAVDFKLFSQSWLLRALVQLMTALALLQLAPTARAQRPPDMSVGEIALLPKYCPDTMGVRTSTVDFYAAPETIYWMSRMGKSFEHMHHYCWAIIKIRRALLPGVGVNLRRNMITNAIGDYAYVIRNSPPNFVLAPEVLLKMGEAYLLLGDAGNALGAFTHAISLKPDFAPPYDRWAESLAQVGDKKAALAFLEDGLKHNPNSTLLREHYQRLGGNLAALPDAPTASPAASVPAPAESASNAASEPARQ